MADFPALRDAAQSVREVLRGAITQSDDLSLNGIEVDLRSPRELETAGVSGVVSLWTHRIEAQPDLVNRAPRRLAPDLEARRATPVDLVLYATAMMADASAGLLVIGRVLQTVSDHRRLADPDLVGSLAATGTELLVAVEPLTAYETNLVWSGLHTAQRIGLGIRVSGVAIDSDLPPVRHAPVVTRQMGVHQVVGVS